MRIKIDEIIYSLKEFSHIMKEDYQLDSVSVYVVEEQDIVKFGYRIEHKTKVFTPYLTYIKIDRNECKQPDNNIWHLDFEGQITEHQTIGEYMDKIFVLLGNFTDSD